MALEGSLDVTVGGDAVAFELTVENADAGSLDLAFRSGMLADFAVLDGDVEVWRWSEGRMFTQALQTRSLDPGETKTVEAEWPDPDPGDYEVVATLASDPGVEVRESFSV